MIHDVRQIHPVIHLTDDIADHRRAHELGDFIEDWHNRFTIEFFTPSSKFIGPEIFHGLILEFFYDGLTGITIGQEFDD